MTSLLRVPNSTVSVIPSNLKIEGFWLWTIYIYCSRLGHMSCRNPRLCQQRAPPLCFFFTGKRQEGHTVWREGVEGADVGLRACVSTCQPSHKTTHLPTPVTKRCLVFLWDGMFDIFDSLGWDSGIFVDISLWLHVVSIFFWWHDSLENILLIQIKHGRMTTYATKWSHHLGTKR